MLTRLSLFAAVVLSSALISSPALAASGPVGAWKLDEGSGTRVADSSGNGNNGVVSGSAAWVPGVSGPGLGFDGSTGEVTVRNAAGLEPATAVSVSAWIKGSTSPGPFRYIVAKGANGCVAASYGIYSGPGGGVQFYVSQSHGMVFQRSPDAGQGVWDGNWHLVVGTYDGSTIRLYVDGVEIGSGTPYPGVLEYVLHDSNDLFIGNYPGCAAHALTGDVDDVMIWNRALGAREISGLMPSPGGSTTPVPPSPPSGAAGGGTGTQPGRTPTSGTGAPKTKDVPPSVHSLTLSASTVIVDPHDHVVSAASTRGLSLSYTESQAANLTVTLLRAETGTRRGVRCVKAAPRSHRLHCTRYVVVTSLARADRAGRLTLRLAQLLRRHLTPGSYRLDVTPRAQGAVGKTVSVRFTVRRSH